VHGATREQRGLSDRQESAHGAPLTGFRRRWALISAAIEHSRTRRPLNRQM